MGIITVIIFFCIRMIGTSSDQGGVSLNISVDFSSLWWKMNRWKCTGISQSINKRTGKWDGYSCATRWRESPMNLRMTSTGSFPMRNWWNLDWKYFSDFLSKKFETYQYFTRSNQFNTQYRLENLFHIIICWSWWKSDIRSNSKWHRLQFCTCWLTVCHIE